jgi:hypothetical protein
MDRSGRDAASWVDQELAGSTFRDERLGRRLRELLVRMAGAVGAPIPLACQDRADTKAAYRFLSNEAVGEAGILAGHFRSTRGRVAAADGPILVLQDTTEFSYRRARPERIGALTTSPSRRTADGRLRMRTVCGLSMHASLAVTTDRLPLGLAATKFWTPGDVQGNERAQAPGQPDPRADRGRPGGHRLEAHHRPADPFAQGGHRELGWYARRWRIELFHETLKSGCRGQEARLRTAERLVNLLALLCILSWRLFRLTMVNRAAPDASPRLALSESEVRLLDRMAGRPGDRSPPATLSSYLTQIARLGGYLARASDPPPGNTVMWRGWSRLMDIKLGAAIANATCG